VFPGTPAAKAALAPGDAITRLGGRPVRQVDEVQLAVSFLPPGTAASIEYRRSGESTTAQLVTTKLAPAGKNIVTVPTESWHGMRVDYATALSSAELSQALASGAFDPQGCVLVSEVQKGSDAWRFGVRAGMFVSQVAGERVSAPAEFHAAARKLGDKFDVRLTIPIEPENEPSQKDANDEK
jgi:serine protease Do